MASPPLGLCSRHAVDAGDLELLARGPVAFRRIPQPVQKPCVLCAGGDRQDRRYRPLCPGGVGTEAGSLEGHRSRIGTGRLPAARPVFCPPSFLPYARWVRADSQPHSSYGTTDHFFSNRNFSDSGRNRISRPWRACSSTRDGLAILDIGLAPSLLFGLGHIEQGQNPLEMAELMLLTGLGAVVFAWLVYRWQSLWFPIALHVCMNLWWELFSVAKSALGGWFPFALQVASILLAIVITLYWTKRKPRPR